MSWRRSALVSIGGGGSVVVDYNEEEKLYRAVIEDKIVDYAADPNTVRMRLAERLECLAKGLRR